MFNVGDDVFESSYGWGVVSKASPQTDYPVTIVFKECIKTYTEDKDQILIIKIKKVGVYEYRKEMN
ncbi:MAG: hypothetical protein ACRC5T_05840 [Cetobacterium sp.]